MDRRCFLFGCPLLPFVAKAFTVIGLPVKQYITLGYWAKRKDGGWLPCESLWLFHADKHNKLMPDQLGELRECRVAGEIVTPEAFAYASGGGIVPKVFEDGELGLRVMSDKDWEGYIDDIFGEVKYAAHEDRTGWGRDSQG